MGPGRQHILVFSQWMWDYFYLSIGGRLISASTCCSSSVKRKPGSCPMSQKAAGRQPATPMTRLEAAKFN